MFDGLITLLTWLRPISIIKWAAYLMVPAAGWVALNYASLQSYLEAQERLAGYRMEVHQLEVKRHDLEKELDALKIHGFPIEKAIREKFSMTRPGERIIYIKPPASAAPPGAAKSEKPAAAAKPAAGARASQSRRAPAGAASAEPRDRTE